MLGGYSDAGCDKDPVTGTYLSIDRLVGFCQKHYRISKNQEGIILGYRYWKGEIQRYVVEDLIG